MHGIQDIRVCLFYARSTAYAAEVTARKHMVYSKLGRSAVDEKMIGSADRGVDFVSITFAFMPVGMIPTSMLVSPSSHI